MHVVVFPGWYPNRADTLSGDFIQRHVTAIALNCRVTVVIPIKDNSIKKAERIVLSKGNLTEIYYYYPSLSKIRLLDNLLSFGRYNLICFIETKKLTKSDKVDLIQLYVLQKNHFVGLIIKALYKIPFVVSEQSTLYVDGQLEKMSRLQKLVLKKVFNKAVSHHAVSKFLAGNIQIKLGLKRGAVIIPNVVDTKLFNYKYKPNGKKVVFIHVSNMVYQKNVQGMLQAFAEVKKVTDNFILNLVGPLPPLISPIINRLGLNENVVTFGAKSYQEVALIMQQSHVFVFFTRFETFGCVIVEANACGLPVIVSDLEVTRELVDEGFNGAFVENENVKTLSDNILNIMFQINTFNPADISKNATEKFNYERVSNQFLNWYSNVLNTTLPA